MAWGVTILTKVIIVPMVWVAFIPQTAVISGRMEWEVITIRMVATIVPMAWAVTILMRVITETMEWVGCINLMAVISGRMEWVDGTTIKKLTRQMHSDSKKRRSFLALLFATGDLRRWAYNKER
jgi:hypothetical protein